MFGFTVLNRFIASCNGKYFTEISQIAIPATVSYSTIVILRNHILIIFCDIALVINMLPRTKP